MAEARTSQTSPLRIDAVEVNSLGARIGMTICPGKRGESQYGGAWNRDLATDLEAVRRWGATAVVTAMESEEMMKLGVGEFGSAAGKLHLQWFHIPITDGAIPDERFVESWPHIAPTVLHELKTGRRILIHCRGGLGRTGLIACLLLVELGLSPQVSLQAVRRARPGTVETREQEQFVLNYRPQFI